MIAKDDGMRALVVDDYSLGNGPPGVIVVIDVYFRRSRQRLGVVPSMIRHGLWRVRLMAEHFFLGPISII